MENQAMLHNYEKSQPASAEKILAKDVSYEDYVIKFDGIRTEWLCGTVVEKASISLQHARIHNLLAMLLFSQQSGRLYMACTLYISEDLPARAPDFMFLSKERLSQVTDSHVNAPVDIVIEIISHGTTASDRGAKFVEYERAGNTEYWLIDSLRKEADVYVLNNEGYYQRLKSPDGKFRSTVLKNFVLDTELFWREESLDWELLLKLMEEMKTDA
jgi:Uma2 family endonuclease